MKTTASLLRHLAAVAAFSALTLTGAQAQTTATTDPVGFITMAIAGGGAVGAPVYTYTALGLLKAVAFQSTTTSVGNDTTLVDPNSTWTDGLYNTNGATPPSHFVEITSGPGAGTQYDITGTTASTHTLNLGGPLLSTITSGASYKIRPHWTIAGVFGTTNQNGLSGGNINSADQILLYRGAGYVTFYYQTSGAGGTGWRKKGDSFADASNNVIYPDDGILIARQQSAPVSLVVSGAVKTGQTSIPVVSGYSLLGNVYAAGMTLTNSNLYTGNASTGLASGNINTADQVMFWNGAGFDTYYYQTSGAGGTGWRKKGDSFTDASGTAIPVGAALFVSRTGAPFNWVAPQTPASF
jgi:uncharacterized protein (TIGR02597 family)